MKILSSSLFELRARTRARPLRRLARRLARLVRQETARLDHSGLRVCWTTETTLSTLSCLLYLKSEVDSLIDSRRSEEQAAAALLRLHDHLLPMISVADPAVRIRRRIGLQAAEAIERSREALDPSAYERATATTFVITTDLICSLMHGLMPPERMAVLAGRVDGGELRASSWFDVTDLSTATRVHVWADPSRLTAALIGMDTSQTRLCGWFHSHPGTGKVATMPSPTDRKQLAEWRITYRPLVAGIVTSDGHVRFWGEDVEGRAVKLKLIGAGLEAVDHHVYRFS